MGHVLVHGCAIVGLGLVLLAAWLFLPGGETDPEDLAPGVRVLVVDASASARRLRAGPWLPWARATLGRECEAAEAAGQDVAVVVFARQAQRRLGPDAPARLRDALLGRGGPPFDPARGGGDDGASDLAGALRAARSLALAPGRRPGEVVLLGDGTHDGEDPRPLLAGLWRDGAAVRAVDPPPRDRADWCLLGLECPPRIEAGAPLRVVARLAWTPAETGPAVRGDGATLDLILSDDAGPSVVSEPLTPPAGGGPWRQAIDLGAAGFGRTEVEAVLRAPGGPDAIPENDRARASTVAGGEAVVGIVAEAEALAAARRWLAPSGTSALSGIQVEAAPLEDLARILPDLDALVTFDLPLHSLDRALVETFVAGGGGWLATAGWRFLHDWTPGEERRGLHRLLPLEPAPLDQGPRDVVLLMDASGSMVGGPFEILRAAAIDLVSAALPTDEVSLRFFTGTLGAERVIKDRQDRGLRAVDEAAEAARRLLRARPDPWGMTYLVGTLEAFATEREGEGRECLAFLLSDGKERDAMSLLNREERCRALLERLRAAQTELVVIGIGEDLDEEMLSLLTRPGEPLLRARSLPDLQAIFRREAMGEQLERGTPLEAGVAALPPPTVRSVARAAQGGGPGPAPPPLLTAVRNRVRSGAEAVWVTAEDAPLLAVHRVGRGRVAQVSTCPIEEWAPAWTDRAGIGEPGYLGPLLRWLARRTDPGTDGVLTAWVEGERLLVDGFAESWPAMVEGRLVESRGGWRDAEAEPGRPVRLVVPAGRPGIDPRTRRVADLPAGFRRDLGARSVTLLLPGRDGEGRILSLDVGLAPEFRPAAARVAVGDPRPTGLEGGPSLGPGGLGRAHPAAPGLLLAGLLFFGMAVFLRKVTDRPIKARPASSDR